MVAWLIVLTILIPWTGAVCVGLVGDKHPNLQHTLALVFALAAAATALTLIPNVTDAPVIHWSIGNGFGDYVFVPDGLGVWLAVIATTIGSLTILFSMDYMAGSAQLGRYYGFMLTFIGAMAGLVLTGSLFLLFVFWEITALCSCALISFNNDDPKAVAGGLKALLITQVGGVGLLCGALLAYAQLGTFDIRALLEYAPSLPPTILSLIAFAFLIAAAAKSAQVPFHTWLPDAMEAPTPVSALIHAATMVNAGIYLLARFYPAFAVVPGWSIAVINVGIISLLLGALMALAADDLKRVLAYSTISQLGYMVYAIGSGAVLASQYHLLSHAIFKALLFLAAGAVIHSTGTRDLRRLGGLSSKLPLVRNAFCIGALALAGLPITNGFFSKELLLETSGQQGPAWAFAIAVLGAGLTALYITRTTWLVFFATPSQAQQGHPVRLKMGTALSLLAVGTLTSWLLLEPLAETLRGSLPFHALPSITLLQMITDLAAAPATYLTLAVIALGLGIWWQRNRLTWVKSVLQPLAAAASDGFRFEVINTHIRIFIQRVSLAVSYTQTGSVSWNLVGIVGGLVGLLVLFALGGLT